MGRLSYTYYIDGSSSFAFAYDSTDEKKFLDEPFKKHQHLARFLTSLVLLCFFRAKAR